MKFEFCVILERKQRVDMYLSALFDDFSRSYIQKLIDNWKVCVNDKQCKKNIKIIHKDIITIEVTSEALENIEPEDMNLDIIYEDDEVVIINKEAWVNTHPVPGEWWNNNTLVNWVLFHCRAKLPSIWWVERPWIVHRLDKDTSWVIAIARNDSMMHYLQDCFKQRKDISKYYLAIVHWVVKDTHLTIESYIGRDKYNRLKMTTLNAVNPKLALSHAEVLGYIENKYTLLKVKIETGRTHQIRVHLASIGHFILWDNTYWNTKINTEIKTKYQLKRQALHAYELHLKLYWKDNTFRAELKEDMKKMIPKELFENLKNSEKSK